MNKQKIYTLLIIVVFATLFSFPSVLAFGSGAGSGGGGSAGGSEGGDGGEQQNNPTPISPNPNPGNNGGSDGPQIPPAPTSCSDGTALNTCSASQPNFCDGNGNLVSQASTCGCPAGSIVSGNSCINSCSDGTALNSCSANQPFFCNGAAQLVSQASTCGCPTGQKVNGNACVANIGPTITVPGAQTVNEGASLAFTVTAVDGDGDAVTLSAANVPANANFNAATGVLTFNPDFTQAGTFTITFTASDGFATDSDTVTITVVNANAPPVLDPIGNQVVNEGDTLTFTVTASDIDNDPITLTAVGLPAGASFINGVVTFTPGFDQAGVFPVTFTASDGQATDTESITITVNNVNQPPVLNLADTTIGEGETLSITPIASDPDGDAVTTTIISPNPLPPGVSFDGVNFVFSPDFEQAGTFDFTFQITDGNFIVTETITITVANTNRAPILDAIGDLFVEVGEVLTKFITGSDPDGDNTVISVEGLPDGARFINGQLILEPLNDDTGEFSATFSITDGVLRDEETIKIVFGDGEVRDLTVRGLQFPDGELVRAGEDIRVVANLKNDGRFDLKDVKVRAFLVDEGIFIDSDLFDIDAEYIGSRVLRFHVPESLAPGVYYMGFSLGNDDEHTVKYRPFEVI